MSPRSFAPRHRPAACRRLVSAAVALGAALGAGQASAVVGGAEDSGPLARAAVMVLSSRGGVCSGVVVAPDAVLTAGHCGSGADQHRIHYRDAGGSPVLLEPAAIAVHPGYDANAIRARRPSVDLALIRVASPLPFEVATLGSSTPVAGSAVTLGGYGVAREADSRSTGTFRTVSLVAIEPYGRSRILLWASDPGRAGGGACQGDSGGPMAEAGGAVAAISSWAAGAGRSRCGETSQGVLVAPQRGWIDRTLAGWGRNASWR